MNERTETAFERLLSDGPIAVNLRLREFAESLREQEVEVLHVEWSPPAEGDQDMIELLDKLL